MRHSIDSLLVRDGRLFAYGWAFDASRPVRALALNVTLEDGQRLRLPVTSGKERPDVAAAFPAEPQARWSGWMAYAGWERSNPRSVELAGTLDDGQAFVLPIQAGLREAAGVEGRLRAWLRQARRTWQLRAGVREQPWVSQEAVIGALAKAREAAGGAPLCLVIDHAMGGGANHYRDEWIRRRLLQAPLVLVLTYEVHGMSYGLELYTSATPPLRLPCTGTLPAALAASRLVDEVFFNDAVSFPRPGEMPQWLLAFAGAGASLTIAIHDYLAVCPSPFLLNDGNTFCGVPAIDECIRCMGCNTNTFPAVQPPYDMPSWRRDWGTALEAAQTVLCFSDSSRRLLLRAYPALDTRRIQVVPHEVRPFAARIQHIGDGPLHVGVVGAIGMHKGAAVVQALAREIARRNSPARITVFGTLEGTVDSAIVRVTGPYDREDLPQLIEGSGANVFLLPSICPETFSFVTHELIGLGLPLACFNLGAPADRIGVYERGRVLEHCGAAALLDDLDALRRDTQPTCLQG